MKQVSPHKRLILIVSFAASIAATIGAIQYSHTTPGAMPAITSTESSDEIVKASIQEDFLKAPAKFDLTTAAKRLSDVTIEEGYHICSPKDEITADQYIDISRMLDTQRSHAVEFKKAVDLALSAPDGVSDCTFRVLTLIDRATP